jgi:transcriptional regulator with XRE-family HTH domain
MTIETVVGARIAALRGRRGLSQAQLGEALGEHLPKPWPRQTVHTAERGLRKLGAAELCAIARVLDIQPGDLLPTNDDARPIPEQADDARALRIGRAVLALVEGPGGPA